MKYVARKCENHAYSTIHSLSQNPALCESQIYLVHPKANLHDRIMKDLNRLARASLRTRQSIRFGSIVHVAKGRQAF